MAYREPQWDEPHTSRSSFDFAAAPAVPASGNPLDTLPPVDRIILLAKAFKVPMTDVAKALRMSREMVYQRLRKARASLETELPEPAPPHACRCGQPRLPGRRRCAACWREQMRARGRAAADASVEVGRDGSGA